MEIIAIEEMLARMGGGQHFKNLRHFADVNKARSQYLVKWQQHIEYRVFSHRVNALFCDERKYICFDERGIWPSSENKLIFKALLNYCLGTEELSLGESICFNSNENDESEAFLQLGLQAGWGGLVISDTDNWFRFSHDSYGSLMTKFSSIESILAIYGVTVDML